MKAVILAGGLGTRISEETQVRPKPMIEIGGKPILWHILKIYSQSDIREFIICLGYKGYIIKEFFANYFLHTADVTFHMAENRMEVHGSDTEPWSVTLVNTGDTSGTGGRMLAVRQYLRGEDEFCLSYGDGVTDLKVADTIAFHRNHGKLATVTAVQPKARFGSLVLDGTEVQDFREKAAGEGGWINGGFFVLSSQVLDYISSAETMWEQQPLTRLAAEGNLHAYFHRGFWQAMDTLRDKQYLEELWDSGKAPWKTW
jgi:glucose-1-phosphate cytidylyltransferase